MDIIVLKTQFEANFGLILKNLEGISAKESLVFPQGANAVNWLLGHIVYSRNLVLSLLGKNSVWNDEHFAFYGRYINAQEVKDKLLDFNELKAYFEQTQKELINGINQLNTSDNELVSKLSFLSLHEIYHCGQIGYARRLLGKEGVIK